MGFVGLGFWPREWSSTMRLTGCWIWLIPVTAMEFMIYDVHSLLRVGGCLRLDHFFGRGMDLDKVCVVDWEIKGTRR